MLLLLLANTWNDGFEDLVKICHESDYWSENENFRNEIATVHRQYETLQQGLPEELMKATSDSFKPGKRLIFEYFKYRLKMAQLKEMAEPDFKIYKQGTGTKKGQYYHIKGYWVEDYEVGMTLKRTRCVHLHLGDIDQFNDSHLNASATHHFREELWKRYTFSSSIIDRLIV